MRKTVTVAALAALALSACGTQPRPPAYYDALPESRSQPLESLFKGDASVISDADIQKILAHKYEFPAHSRIAILPLSSRGGWSTWSDEFAGLNASMEDAFTSALKASGKVYDASYLPAIVVPDKRTVPYLREAAARYQADLMLLYRADCKSFNKNRVFASNQSRSYCTVDAVVLDTRTGIVPFTSTVSRSYDTVQGTGDMVFAETVQRAELTTVGALLVETAGKLSTFMSTGKSR